MSIGELMPDAAASLEKIFTEVEALIRKRLEEADLLIPYVVVAATPEDQIMLRSNVSTDGLRSFGDDLKSAADDIDSSLGQAPPGRGH